MKKILLLSAILISLYGRAQSLRAEPDTFTVLQASVDTFAVTAVDSILVGDSVCISLVGSPAGFSVLNCHSILFQPDSTFTGRDTCVYALCDTAGICDTAMVVVYVDTNYALLPVVSFKQDSLNIWYQPLFYNGGFYGGHAVCGSYTLSSTSIRYDSVAWTINDTCSSCYLYPLRFGNTDTITFDPMSFFGDVQISLSICIIAYNKFGSTTYCDTTMQLEICEGIAEVPLANIHIYPDPADRVLTIDMRQNTDAISVDYASINVYDNLGQKVRSIPRHDSSRLVEVPVASLPEGIYLSTITDAGGAEMMLGKFTVLR